MKRFNLKVLATAFTLLGACDPSAPADDPASQPAAAPTGTDVQKDPNLLAKVEIADGDVVEFYEPTPGHVAMSETFLQANPPANRRALARMSPTQAYSTLAPGAPIPEKLIQAEQRARDLRAKGPVQGAVQPTKEGGGGEDLAAKSQAPGGPVVQHTEGAYSPSYFMSWAPGCPNNYDENYYNWCKTDVGGTWYYYASDADAVYAVSCADVGNATFQVTTDGTSSWSMTPGQCRGWEEFVSDDPFDFADFYVMVKVIGANGSSRFHFAGYLEW